jgi:hypothetical protein
MNLRWQWPEPLRQIASNPRRSAMFNGALAISLYFVIRWYIRRESATVKRSHNSVAG